MGELCFPNPFKKSPTPRWELWMRNCVCCSIVEICQSVEKRICWKDERFLLKPTRQKMTQTVCATCLPYQSFPKDTSFEAVSIFSWIHQKLKSARKSSEYYIQKCKSFWANIADASQRANCLCSFFPSELTIFEEKVGHKFQIVRINLYAWLCFWK